MKKKDIKKIVIAIIITLVALFAVKKITAVQTEKGNKTIHLVVQTSDTPTYFDYLKDNKY